MIVTKNGTELPAWSPEGRAYRCSTCGLEATLESTDLPCAYAHMNTTNGPVDLGFRCPQCGDVSYVTVFEGSLEPIDRRAFNIWFTQAWQLIEPSTTGGS